MIESLADIEALTLRCRSEQSREYIAEAVLCYRGGAYRATIVNTWIAIVFDLIDKIRELALSGDATAKALEQQYDTYLDQIDKGSEQGIKSALQFERDILSTSKDKLQLFDQQQFKDLQRLREDRHRCAHPSFQKVGEPYRPSAEQARLHLRNAVLYVLGQPPVQGRAALTELKSLVSSSYFPSETAKAVTQLKSSALDKASEALVRGFVDELLFGFFDASGPLLHKRQVVSAINAVLEMYRPIVEQRLSKQMPKLVRDQPDAEFPYVASLVAYISGAWSLLDTPARDKVVQFVAGGKASEVIKVLSGLRHIETLVPEVDARVQTLNLEELADAIASYGLGSAGKKRAIDLLADAHSYNRVNDLISKTLLPMFEFLDKNDLEKIIRLPFETGADMIGATSYGTLIERVRREALFSKDELDKLLKENRAEYLLEE